MDVIGSLMNKMQYMNHVSHETVAPRCPFCIAVIGGHVEQGPERIVRATHRNGQALHADAAIARVVEQTLHLLL
jgi:hypothetical protein